MQSPLVGNAAKLTPQSDARTQAHESARTATGAALKFAVANIGIGIGIGQSSPKSARLFTPFGQLQMQVQSVAAYRYRP